MLGKSSAWSDDPYKKQHMGRSGLANFISHSFRNDGCQASSNFCVFPREKMSQQEICFNPSDDVGWNCHLLTLCTPQTTCSWSPIKKGPFTKPVKPDRSHFHLRHLETQNDPKCASSAKWCFQPMWKISTLVKLDHFSRHAAGMKIKHIKKPQPSLSF